VKRSRDHCLPHLMNWPNSPGGVSVVCTGVHYCTAASGAQVGQPRAHGSAHVSHVSLLCGVWLRASWLSGAPCKQQTYGMFEPLMML